MVRKWISLSLTVEQFHSEDFEERIEEFVSELGLVVLA
jgi:hypothetical protein